MEGVSVAFIAVAVTVVVIVVDASHEDLDAAAVVARESVAVAAAREDGQRPQPRVVAEDLSDVLAHPDVVRPVWGLSAALALRTFGRSGGGMERCREVESGCVLCAGEQTKKPVDSRVVLLARRSTMWTPRRTATAMPKAMAQRPRTSMCSTGLVSSCVCVS